MPLNLKNLPHEGYSERENSDAVNQIIQFAGSGADVFAGTQFIIPADHFENVGTFRVNDPRVTVNSQIFLTPVDAVSTLAAVFISTIGDGFFDIDDAPPDLQFAATQVIQENGSINTLVNGVVLPFDTTTFNDNFTIDLVLNRVISKIIGLIFGTITISGQYAIGEDYEFGVEVFDINDVSKGVVTIKASTSNQNDVISVAGSFIVSNVIVGDYYVPFGLATGPANTFLYDMALTFQTMSPSRGVIITQELKYRYINII